MIITVSIIEELKNRYEEWNKMSLIVCSESECIDKILEDYNENVLSKKRTSKDRTLKEDYYLWANQKYQALVKMLSNHKNSQLVYKALNFITYLDLYSIPNQKIKREVRWDEFFDWERRDMKESLKQEFDPVGQEKRKIVRMEIC